ncbi:MAG: hypothetical protein E7470_07435 [Ruminococcaceae bacterium]|nr:hypothetical protein [Oscillospiraceae bacterium]
MNRYIENLKVFLAEQTPCYCYDDAHSLLEVLYYCYATANPVDNATIHFQFQKLNDILRRLTRKEIDSVFSVACDLCISHERQAFLDGIHVGMRLFSELYELPTQVQEIATSRE